MDRSEKRKNYYFGFKIVETNLKKHLFFYWNYRIFQKILTNTFVYYLSNDFWNKLLKNDSFLPNERFFTTTFEKTIAFFLLDKRYYWEKTILLTNDVTYKLDLDIVIWNIVDILWKLLLLVFMYFLTCIQSLYK